MPLQKALGTQESWCSAGTSQTVIGASRPLLCPPAWPLLSGHLRLHRPVGEVIWPPCQRPCVWGWACGRALCLTHQDRPTAGRRSALPQDLLRAVKQLSLDMLMSRTVHSFLPGGQQPGSCRTTVSESPAQNGRASTLSSWSSASPGLLPSRSPASPALPGRPQPTAASLLLLERTAERTAPWVVFLRLLAWAGSGVSPGGSERPGSAPVSSAAAGLQRRPADSGCVNTSPQDSVCVRVCMCVLDWGCGFGMDVR